MKASVLLRCALDELFDYTLYLKMSSSEKNPRNRKLFSELAQQEYEHYLFWSKFTGPLKLSLRDNVKVKLLLAASRILGKVFIVKYLESKERTTSEIYRRLIDDPRFTEEDKGTLKKIVEDEEAHEKEFLNQVDEYAVRYLGSMALGMSDAMIEMSGVLAGFLGFTESSVQTGIAGLIVGVSASMSMAAASFLQAKHEIGKKPGSAALTTGIFYLSTVGLLTLPFFTGLSMLVALMFSMLLALAVLAAFTFYSSTILGGKFLREYFENMLVIILVVAAGFIFGDIVKELAGMTHI
ncbi:MAG: VIT1/CCC1 family protein [Thermofilaceae archaeon]